LANSCKLSASRAAEDFQLEGGEGLFFAGIQVQGFDGQASVWGDLEGELDVRPGARGGRDAVEGEAADTTVADELVVVPLEDVDADRGLVVGPGREGFAQAGRDGRPAGDEYGGDFVDGFDPQGLGQHRRRDLVYASAPGAWDHAARGFECGSAAGTGDIHRSNLLLAPAAVLSEASLEGAAASPVLSLSKRRRLELAADGDLLAPAAVLGGGALEQYLDIVYPDHRLAALVIKTGTRISIF
jgi:hypothetical protein